METVLQRSTPPRHEGGSLALAQGRAVDLDVAALCLDVAALCLDVLERERANERSDEWDADVPRRLA